MKLYKIFQEVNAEYDTYDEAIVCAENEDKAKIIHPDGYGDVVTSEPEKYSREYSSWCTLKDVQVEYIGEAREGLKEGVICASYNAG